MLSSPGVLEKWKPYFYRSHQGEEIDLLLYNGVACIAVDCKASSSPIVSKGLRIACRDLGVDAAWVVAPVARAYSAADGIMVGRLDDVIEQLT